jgi:Restriction endonuclease
LSNVLLDNKLTITIGQGHAARKHVMDIKPFTLIGTCPKKADCPQELMKEFSLVLALQPYSTDSLQAIASNNAKKLGAVLELGAAGLISSSSDGRPGSVESLLRRVLKAVNKDVVTADDVAQAFKVFGIKASADMPTNGYGNIQNLSGVDFEKLITNLLVRMGFQAEMTRTSGDGGIDIVAMLDKPIIGGRYLFQCKRFAPDNLIGAPTLRDFYGAVTADRAVKGVFITTSDFTTQAKDFAQKSGLELINLGQLQRLLQEYGLIDTQAV